LKNTHLRRCAHPSPLRRTKKYASFLVISRALQLNVFDQPVKKHFFNKLIDLSPGQIHRPETAGIPLDRKPPEGRGLFGSLLKKQINCIGSNCMSGYG
jgi:hypothetical protein